MAEETYTARQPEQILPLEDNAVQVKDNQLRVSFQRYPVLTGLNLAVCVLTPVTALRRKHDN